MKMRKIIALLIRKCGLLCFSRVVISHLLRKLDVDEYLNALGIKHGNGCRVYNASFGGETWLIELGDYVSIGSGTQFITHDGGVWVLRNLTGNHRLDYFAKIKIGNNVFIGNEAMILPGVTIGNNVVIGAKSLVTKSIPSNSVACGVPAHVIKTINEYARKADKCVDTHGMRGKDRQRRILESIESVR